jgi:hypothetical protein
MSEKHLASALELVTDGHATRDVRASWRRRGLLITPATRAEAVGGRPLVYSRLALVEGRLLYQAGQDGIDLSVVSAAYRKRIEREGHRQLKAEALTAVVGGYLDPETDLDPHVFDAAVRSGGLREFEALEPGENDRYWLIAVEGRQVRVVAGELVHLPAALARILTPHRVHVPVVVTNISAAVRAVDRALKAGK